MDGIKLLALGGGNGIVSLFPCFFPIAFLILASLMWIIANAFEKRKLAKFMQFALANGLTFRPGMFTGGGSWFDQMFSGVQGNRAFLAELEGFRPISHMNATVKYIFEGKTGDMPFMAFQYQYTTGSGKNRQTHYYMVAVCEMPIWLPQLSISTEGFFDTVGKFFGGQDMQFESHEFNEKFRITGTNEKFAHDILHPQMMEWFMHVVPPGFQMRDRKIVLWRGGALREEFVLDSRAMLRQFWELVPDYVKEDQGR